MTEDREDREAWTEGHRRQVRIVYGMATGGVLVSSGVLVLVYAMKERLLGEVPVIVLGAGLLLTGLASGAPHVWLPVLSALLKRIPFLKEPPANGDLTQVVEALQTEDDDE